MTDEQIQRVVYETYAVHFVVTRAGIEPDDIFVGVEKVVNASPPGYHAVVIVKKDGKQCVFWTAPMAAKHDRKRFLKAWSLFSNEQPKMPRIELDVIVVTSQTWEMRGQLLTALRAQGFDVVDPENLN